MEKQISIIIPTYNMEKYIGKCLDSLLIPELDRVEVLVVNDGSKDRSSEIAHSYADRYPGSIRVIDKANGNYGSCINAALPLCTGRYVKILDADDTFDTEAFSKFVGVLESTDADAVVTPYFNVDGSGIITRKDPPDFPNTELYRTYSTDLVDERALIKASAMHRLTYRSEIFTRFDYHQTEGVSYTDNQWDKIPLAFANSILFTDIYLYRYLLGREGQTMDPIQRARSLAHIIKVGKDMIETFEKRCAGAKLHEFLHKRILLYAVGPFYSALDSSTDENMTLLKDYDEYLENNNNQFYTELGNIPYSDNCRFRFIKDIRRKNYMVGYRLPFATRAKLFISSRIKRICK